MGLLELFRETFPEVHIETLYADREFIGNGWLAYLRQAGISYGIRCKQGKRADSGKRWHKAGAEWSLSGAENR